MEEIYGIEKGAELYKKFSIVNIGRKPSKETIEKQRIASIKWHEEIGFSDATKEKMRIAAEGKPKSKEHRLKIKINNKKRWESFEERKKQSARKQHIPLSEWIGFSSSLKSRIRNSKEYNDWRISIFKRDGYICQECRTPGGSLEVHHHIKSFAQIIKENNVQCIKDALNCMELWNIDYGKTVCIKCHNKIDKYRRNLSVYISEERKERKKETTRIWFLNHPGYSRDKQREYYAEKRRNTNVI